MSLLWTLIICGIFGLIVAGTKGAVLGMAIGGFIKLTSGGPQVVVQR